MATIVDTYVKDGETINVYESGAEYNVTRKHLVKSPPSAKITPERSRELREIRARKTARLIREAIVTETMDALEVPKHGAAESVAAAAGILWREIVLNPEAYARDRIAAFEKLTERAEMTNTDKRGDTEKNDTGSSVVTGVLRQLTEFLRAAHGSGDAIDGEATDVPALPQDTDIRNE